MMDLAAGNLAGGLVSQQPGIDLGSVTLFNRLQQRMACGNISERRSNSNSRVYQTDATTNGRL